MTKISFFHGAFFAAYVAAAMLVSQTASSTPVEPNVRLSTKVNMPSGDSRVLDILEGQDHVQVVDTFLNSLDLNTPQVRSQLLEYVESQLQRVEPEASEARKPLIFIPVQIEELDKSVTFSLYDGDSISDTVQEFCRKHVVPDAERVNECMTRLRDRLDEIIWQAIAPENTVETIPIFVRGVRHPLYIREDMTALEIAYDFANTHQLLRTENARQYINKLEQAIGDRILAINLQRKEDAAAAKPAQKAPSQQKEEGPRETATLYVSDTPYELNFLASVPSPVIAQAFCGPQGLQLKDNSLEACVQEAQQIIEESRVPLAEATETQQQATASNEESPTTGELNLQIGDAGFSLEFRSGEQVDVVARTFCTSHWPDVQQHLAKEFSFADSPIDLKFCASVVAETLKRYTTASA